MTGAAGAVVAEVARDGEPVDFVRVERGDPGIAAYLTKSTKPFYVRPRASLLRSLFGAGRS